MKRDYLKKVFETYSITLINASALLELKNESAVMVTRICLEYYTVVLNQKQETKCDKMVTDIVEAV